MTIKQWMVAHGYKSFWHELRAATILITLIWFMASAAVSGSNLILNHGVDGFITPFGITLDGIQGLIHWYESYMTVQPL